jgi:hypothetical protein
MRIRREIGGEKIQAGIRPLVAQVSKPAVSPISKSAGREPFQAHQKFSSRAG